MNDKIGNSEAASSVTFVMLPMLILTHVGQGILKHNSGYWINYIICFLLGLFLLKTIKYSFYTAKVNSKISICISMISKIAVLLLVSFSTFYNFSVCTDAILSVTSKIFLKDILCFLPVVASVICALCGIEALTRSSYILFYICEAIILVMCVITFDGWDFENLLPIMGNNTKTTFLDFSSLGVYVFVLIVYALRDNTGRKSEGYNIAKRSIISVFVFGLIIVLICILTIPYPMGSLYNFSLQGIFSIAKAGSFFHRFEILLAFMLLIIDVASLSLGIYLMSTIISKLTLSKDYRPFCLIFGVIIFYFNLVYNVSDFILKAINVISLIIYGLLIIKSIIYFVQKYHKKVLR